MASVNLETTREEVSTSEQSRLGITAAEISVLNVWVRVEVDPHWVVACRMAIQNDKPVIGELRLFPSDGTHIACEWSARLQGPWAQVPYGGVSSKLLRQINIGEVVPLLAEVQRVITRMRKVTPHALPASAQALEAAFPDRGSREGVRRGPKGRPDRYYAKIAKAYADRIAAGDRSPIRTLATRRRTSLAQVRAAVHQARIRGFLSGGHQGKRGGILTAAARQLLG